MKASYHMLSLLTWLVFRLQVLEKHLGRLFSATDLDGGLKSQVWKKIYWSRGQQSTWLACLLSNPSVLGSIPSVPEIFSEEKIVDVGEVYQLRW